MQPLVLGSASIWRRQLLSSMGIAFTPMSADIDEKGIRHPDPRIMTINIALAKAAALYPRVPSDALLITCDQVAVYRGQVREKPADDAETRRWLMEYGPDEPVRTVTSVVVLDARSKRTRHCTDVAAAWFERMPVRAIEAAISRGSIQNSCGAFAIDDPDLAPFVAMVEGDGDEDEVRASITGLPMAKTLRLLASFGWHLPDHDWSETT